MSTQKWSIKLIKRLEFTTKSRIFIWLLKKQDTRIMPFMGKFGIPRQLFCHHRLPPTHQRFFRPRTIIESPRIAISNQGRDCVLDLEKCTVICSNTYFARLTLGEKLHFDIRCIGHIFKFLLPLTFIYGSACNVSFKITPSICIS